MTDERELDAVLAHGLLNSVTVVSGAAYTLREHHDRLDDQRRGELLEAFRDSATLLADGLGLIVRACSDPFGDAATSVALAARAIDRVRSDELPPVLAGIEEHCVTLQAGLAALVRGLPREVRDVLDAMA